MKILGTERKLDADTIFRYTWKKRPHERILFFDSAHVITKQNDQELMNTFMSRDKVIDFSKGKRYEVLYENAAEEVRTSLRDSFRAPICKLVTGKNGEEKITIVARPGAKDLLDNGMIANALLFHPWFPTGRNQWQSTREISMGNGGYAKGSLTYIKQAGGKAGQIPVKVSGTLTNDGFKMPNSSLSIKAARYVVNGSQTYDTARGEWISGKLSLKISFQMTNNENLMATAEGAMQITLEMPVPK
jgi:hypothetical protein